MAAFTLDNKKKSCTTYFSFIMKQKISKWSEKILTPHFFKFNCCKYKRENNSQPGVNLCCLTVPERGPHSKKNTFMGPQNEPVSYTLKMFYQYETLRFYKYTTLTRHVRRLFAAFENKHSNVIYFWHMGLKKINMKKKFFISMNKRIEFVEWPNHYHFTFGTRIVQSSLCTWK